MRNCKAFVETITNNKVVVRCPYCNQLHEYKRCHTDEGEYIQQCPNVGRINENRFKYTVNKEEIYR